MVDFLPAHYLERSRKRRNDLWRLLVVALLGGVIACTAIFVHEFRRRAEDELVRFDSLGTKSTTTSSKLAALNAQLQPIKARAELLTYLRYPWPRTRLMSCVLQPLPASIKLTRLHIVREPTEKSDKRSDSAAAKPAAPTSATATSGSASKSPPPMLSDLQRLRADCERLQSVVLLSGTVSDPSALYDYLGKLGGDAMFSRVELGPVERSGNDEDPTRFTARLTVRPGHGQLNGPERSGSEPPKPSIAGLGLSGAKQ